MIGRRADLARLENLVDRLGAGDRTVVAVAGDPGIGKTRLLAEVAARAQRSGRLVLSGRAAEFERHVPFGIVADALDDHVAAAGPDRFAGLRADELGLLAEVFPSWPSPPAIGSGPDLIEAERYRLHRAIRALLELLAAPAGLVLVLDDVHWIDDGSAELLDHLLRHPPRGDLLIVLAHRPRQTPGRLRRGLARAVEDGVAELIELGPLTPAEAARLLPADMDEAHRAGLYETSGGNPFYLLALFRDGAWKPRMAGTAAATGVPAAVEAALAGEVAALTAGQLLVARAAAVAGDGAEPRLVAQIAGLGLDEVLGTLDELAGRDLVRPEGSAGRFQFRHPLVRRATYEAAGSGWRAAAHARAAAALGARGAPATELAHHVEHSAEIGDMQAVDVLRDAATATMYSTPATAAHWLRAALRLLPAGGPGMPLRLALLGMYARALAATGQLRESRTVLQELLVLLPAEFSDARVEVVANSAVIERLLGQPAEANAMLRTELARLPDQHGPAALELKLGLANGVVARQVVDLDNDWVAEALLTARRNPSQPLLAAAMAMAVLVDCLGGADSERILPALDETAALVDALPDGELGPRLQAILWLSIGEVYAERMDDAMRHLRRGTRVARTTGQSQLVGYLHGMLGVVHALVGNLREAADLFDNEHETGLMTGSVPGQGMALQHQSWLALWTGDIGEALRLGKEAVAAVREGAGLIAQGAVGELAQAHLYAGDPATCIEMMVGVGGGDDLPAVEPFSRFAWFEALAAAHVALGRTDEAAAWADRAEHLAAGLPLPRRLAYASFARIHTLLPADPAGALACARHGLAAAERSDDPVATGRAHLFVAMALAATGDADLAREAFARARTLLETCGARLFLNQVIREQRRMNARFPRRSRAERENPATGAGRGSAGLTVRERQVAEWVAQGLTNRQVAEKLFLSPKTVGVHLERVYAKLGVSRRAAVAAALGTDEPEPAAGA